MAGVGQRPMALVDMVLDLYYWWIGGSSNMGCKAFTLKGGSGLQAGGRRRSFRTCFSKSEVCYIFEAFVPLPQCLACGFQSCSLYASWTKA